MDKKVLKKRIIAIISMVIIVIAFIFVSQKFYLRRMDNGMIRMEGFYLEDKDSLDVVFMGASEVYQAYSAADAYRLYGFTSYPYAFVTNPVTLWKYELEEIMKRQSPKLIVVELNGSVYDENHLYKEMATRYLTDTMPMSRNKINLVRDMGTEDELSYYLPFAKYHGEVQIKDFVTPLKLYMRGHNILRGTFAHTWDDEVKEELDLSKGVEPLDLHPDAEERLREFLEICKTYEDTDFLFVRVPHLTVDDGTLKRYRRYVRSGQIVEEYGFEYIDLDVYRDEMGLDVSTDFYNGEHLNANGMKKFTEFFGNLIKDKYNLSPTELSPKQKEEWDESAIYAEKFYECYQEVKAQKLGEVNLWDNEFTFKKIREKLKSQGGE